MWSCVFVNCWKCVDACVLLNIMLLIFCPALFIFLYISVTQFKPLLYVSSMHNSELHSAETRPLVPQCQQRASCRVTTPMEFGSPAWHRKGWLISNRQCGPTAWHCLRNKQLFKWQHYLTSLKHILNYLLFSIYQVQSFTFSYIHVAYNAPNILAWCQIYGDPLTEPIFFHPIDVS